MEKTILLLIRVFLLGLALSACTPGAPEFRGAVYAPPAPAANFSLPATTGDTFTLQEQTGDVVLLFFGYTYCPDICPATLGTLKAAMSQLSEAERERVVIVFVTVDPERDTVEQLGRYLKAVDPTFIGVVPTLEELETLKSQYGVFAEKEEVQPDGSYLMAHTGVVYGINPQGHLQVGFFNDLSSEDIAHDISLLLKP